jgi:hypothetical protein
LPDGYQVAQTAHGVAEFAIRFPSFFMSWNNQNIVCLSTSDEESLRKLLKDLGSDDNTTATGFYEPDLGGQLTTVTAVGTGVKKYTKMLDLTLNRREQKNDIGTQNDK